MRWRHTLIPTLRQVPKEAEATSHQLLLKAGLIHKLSSGVYSYLPLGFRVLQRISAIIREEMTNAGAEELLMPSLHPAELWKKTGRYDALGEDKISFKNRSDQEFVLGPTHEEVITDLVGTFVQSYSQLPISLYQIQTKFRDELRPRFGIVRTKEFIMKDAYSFDRDEAGLAANYQKMYKAYIRIFQRMGLAVCPVEADAGVMGGSDSHEFMVLAESGEDKVVRCTSCHYAASLEKHIKQDSGQTCPACKNAIHILPAIEVGHIFQLKTKYSAALKATFLDEDGKQKPFIMGCYGIGVTRILAAVIETNCDEAGIRWPVSIAPYPIVLIPIQLDDPATRQTAENLYRQLSEAHMDLLFDDRDLSGGVKMKDADLIGFPIRIVLSNKTLQQSSVESKRRRESEAFLIKQSDILPALTKELDKESMSV